MEYWNIALPFHRYIGPSNYGANPPQTGSTPWKDSQNNLTKTITIKVSSAEAENCKQSDVKSTETPPTIREIITEPNLPVTEKGNKNNFHNGSEKYYISYRRSL